MRGLPFQGPRSVSENLQTYHAMKDLYAELSDNNILLRMPTKDQLHEAYAGLTRRTPQLMSAEDDTRYGQILTHSPHTTWPAPDLALDQEIHAPSQ